jgi:CRP-like cAMP-binding protein
MYLILSGEVRVLRMSASVEAVSDVRVLELTPDAVHGLARQDGAFARALAQRLSARAGRVPAFLDASHWPGNTRS